jgi:hypothetical protein
MVEKATNAASAAICAARTIARCLRAPRNTLHPSHTTSRRVVGTILSVIGQYGGMNSLQQMCF